MRARIQLAEQRLAAFTLRQSPRKKACSRSAKNTTQARAWCSSAKCTRQTLASEKCRTINAPKRHPMLFLMPLATKKSIAPPTLNNNQFPVRIVTTHATMATARPGSAKNLVKAGACSSSAKCGRRALKRVFDRVGCQTGELTAGGESGPKAWAGTIQCLFQLRPSETDFASQ